MRSTLEALANDAASRVVHVRQHAHGACSVFMALHCCVVHCIVVVRCSAVVCCSVVMLCCVALCRGAAVCSGAMLLRAVLRCVAVCHPVVCCLLFVDVLARA